MKTNRVFNVAKERVTAVLLAPHDTEKSNFVSEQHNQVVFKVRSDASKSEIKRAVETLFNVKVKAVSTSHVKAKRIERFGRLKGFSRRWKKAYVALQPGFEINFADIT